MFKSLRASSTSILNVVNIAPNPSKTGWTAAAHHAAFTRTINYNRASMIVVFIFINNKKLKF